MKAQMIIPLFLALAMTWAIKVAWGYPYQQAKLSVIFVAGMVVLLALVQLAREVRFSRAPRSHQPTAEAAHGEHGGHEASAAQYGGEASWMGGFALAIYLFGFTVAMPIFIAAYMKTHGTKWAPSLITGVLMAAFCYGIFTWFFEMNLYPGVFFAK